MKTLSPIAVMPLLVVAFCATAQDVSQSQETASSADTDSEKPYQIVVTGRVTRARLRELIADVEDDFFEKFNELNIDDAYDVLCYKFTPTMSHISQRVCEPAFKIRERAFNASEVGHILACSGFCGDTGLSAYLMSPRDLNRQVKPDFETLQEKLEELSRTDEEFRQIGNVLAELKYRLDNYSEQ